MSLKIKDFKNQIIISSCMYLGQALIGYALTWTGPILPKFMDLKESPLPYLLTDREISFIASSLYMGSIPAPYIMMWLSNYKGRKPCLIIGGIITIVAYTLLSTARNLAMIYCGRILKGFGLAVICVINMIYIGEIASTPIRGILLTIGGIFMTCGAILLYSIGGFFSYHVTTYVGLCMAIVLTLGAFMIPESPIFHAIKGDEDALGEVLEFLGRKEEKKEIYDSKKEYKSSNIKRDWIELFSVKLNRRALFILIIINVLQQCSGVMVILFYAASIFENAGSSISSNIGMIVIGCFRLFGSVISPFLVEKVGRRTLLLMSTALCCISMLSLGLYFYLDYIKISSINNVKWLPLVILITFFIGFDSGLGIIPNVLTGEMFTSNARSNGSTLAITSAWLAGFLVTLVFDLMIGSFGSYGTYWFYSSVCACAFMFTIFFIPETKAKSLLEIQQLMNSN